MDINKELKKYISPLASSTPLTFEPLATSSATDENEMPDKEENLDNFFENL